MLYFHIVCRIHEFPVAASSVILSTHFSLPRILTSQGNSLVDGYDDRDTKRSQNTTVPASTLAEGIASPTFNANQDDSPASMSTASYSLSDLVLSPVEQATASVQIADDFVDNFEATHPGKQDLFTEIV
jgi:hypothetical protein